MSWEIRVKEGQTEKTIKNRRIEAYIQKCEWDLKDGITIRRKGVW